MKLLVVEDNQQLLDIIVNRLRGEQYICESATDFFKAQEKVGVYFYDLLIVDINLPGGSGLELIRQVKKQEPATGIIVISARNSLDNKIEGLELGADDYLTKPFDVSELAARVKALIRRKNFSGQAAICYGDISMDTTSREVTANGEIIELTKSEYDILLFFFSNPGRVLTRESIAEHIWGDHMDLADSYDFIYSHIKNLRKKITATGARDLIKAIYGIGYKLDV